MFLNVINFAMQSRLNKDTLLLEFMLYLITFWSLFTHFFFLRHIWSGRPLLVQRIRDFKERAP